MLVIMIQCAGVARACGPTLKLVRCALLATEDGAAGLVRHPAMLMKCVCVLRLVGAQCTCHCRCQAGHAVSYYGSAAVPATSWTSSWDDWDYAAPRRRWADLRDEEGDGDAARRRGLLAAPLASPPLLVTASEFPKKLDESQGVAWVVLALGMLTRPRGFRSLHF